MNAVAKFSSDDLYTFFFTGRYPVPLNRVPGGTALIQPNLSVPSDTIRYFEFPESVPCAERKNRQVLDDYEISRATSRPTTCTHFFFYMMYQVLLKQVPVGTDDTTKFIRTFRYDQVL